MVEQEARICALVLVLLAPMLVVLAGCTPATLPTAELPATSGHSTTGAPAPHVLAPPAYPPPPTVTPAPTSSPTPTSTAVFPLVAFESRVREYLVPELEGRIEWARYVTGPTVFEAGKDPVLAERGTEAMFDPFGRRNITADEMPDDVVIVKASSLSVPFLYGSHRSYEGVPDLDAVGLESLVEREFFYILFDAHDGRIIASIADGAPGHSDASWLDDVEALATQPPSTGREVLPASPTPTHSSARSDPAETPSLPAAVDSSSFLDAEDPLARAMASYPLLPGSTWVWRATNVWGGVRRSRWWYTDTVEAAVLAEEGAMLVRRRVEGSEAGPARPGEHEVRLWRVTPRLALPYGRWPDPDEVMAEPQFKQFFDEKLPEDLSFIVEPTRATFPREVAARDVQVVAAGQRFDDCVVIHFVGGAGWGTYRWFCPGVGYVRSEQYSNRGHLTLRELMSFEPPTLNR